jgi:asparagine synthase (glutamine-hydrolysing)
MCGINGIVINKTEKHFPQAKSIIQTMNNDIIHRGPDSDGFFENHTENIAVFLGMRRLSIIDVEGGSQPFYSEDKSIVIVFNGEVYNFLILREELIKDGFTFISNSDTEVVLKMYEKYGVNCLSYLNGMFAFSIYDHRNRKVFIARDRVGEKPLYYYKDDKLLIWASELKSIKRNFDLGFEINKDALRLYFSLTFIPAPYTIYNNIFKLEPGCYLEYDLHKNTLVKNKYWDIVKPTDQSIISDYGSAKKAVKEILFDAVEKRMITDVPLGVFLSGGIDSSIVAAIMADVNQQKRINTFSIGFTDKRFDESERAALVANHIKSEHHLYILNYNDLIHSIDDIILNYDEPFADSSALPSYWISKQARRSVKVALTGDGGDEVFGGYNRYLIKYYSDKIQQFLPNKSLRKHLLNFVNWLPHEKENRNGIIARLKKMLNASGNDDLTNFSSIISLGFQNEELTQLFDSKNEAAISVLEFIRSFSDNYATFDSLKMMRYIDKNISLDGDMLVKVDRASMLASLECRAPFLDYRLFELSNRLPDAFLINKRLEKKKILRDTFEDLLPSGLFELPKKGFGVPVGQWLSSELREQLLKLSKREFIQQQGIFNYSCIENLISDHVAGRKDNTFKLWTFFCFQKWYIANM